MKRLLFSTFLMVSLTFPLASLAATLSLTKDGPKTAREGDLIEFSLEVVNEGTTNVVGISVLDTLPAEVQFVQATPTPGGTYNSMTGVWTLPTLGTDANDKTAGLQIQVMVNQNLINNPDDVVDTTNRAEVMAPPDQTPLEAQVTTNIVCTSCIDWEIVSVSFDWQLRDLVVMSEDDTDFDARFFLFVNVINNGPVTSDATVIAKNFSVQGGGFRGVELFPNIPVAVTLDPGQAQGIEFRTDWEDGDDFDFKVYWQFEVNDVALLDPILPNTRAGSWEPSDNGSSGSSSGDCFVATAAYGSYLDPKVKVLRDFRDQHLLTNAFGTELVKFYYRHSPPIARHISERETHKSIVRSVLTVVVYSIEYPVAAVFTLLFFVALSIGTFKRRKSAGLIKVV